MKRSFSALFLRSYDWVLIGSTIVLSVIGLAAIYSVDLSRGETLSFFPTQMLALGIGLAALFVGGSVHMSLYERTVRLGYVFAILLLIGVLFFGQTVRGTTGWFRFSGVSFQPAELAKLMVILMLGWWMHLHARRFDRWQFVFTSGIIALLPAGLILLQPDLGSASLLFAVWFGLLLLSGIKKRHVLVLACLSAVVSVVAWFALLAPYQKERLLTFMDPAHDPLGSGYNVNQSIIAVGSGQLFGRGLGFGSQSQLRFLPEAQTDFVFSVIAEEMGFVAVVVVFLLYGVIVWRLLRIARLADTDFAAYTVLGIVLLLSFHVVVNVGGATGLLPVTGVTLPFLSYGGTSLILNCLLIGIALSIARSTQSAELLYQD